MCLHATCHRTAHAHVYGPTAAVFSIARCKLAYGIHAGSATDAEPLLMVAIATAAELVNARAVENIRSTGF